MISFVRRFGLGSDPLTAAAVAAAGWLGSGHGAYWSGKHPSHAAVVYPEGAADPTAARPVSASRHSYHLYQHYT